MGTKWLKKEGNWRSSLKNRKEIIIIIIRRRNRNYCSWWCASTSRKFERIKANKVNLL